MDKILHIFAKRNESESGIDSVQNIEKQNQNEDEIEYDDVPRLEGVDGSLFEPESEYNNQIQTQMFRERPSESETRSQTRSQNRSRVWGAQPLTGRQTQVQMQELQFTPMAVDDTKMIYVEEQEIDTISEEVLTLKEIAQDMAILLDIQEENLEKIDTHVENSTQNVEAATEEVQQTMRYMKKMNYKKGVITTTGCAAIGGAIGVLGGPPGIAIGAGIGGAVGLVGSTISSIVERTL